MSSSDDKDNPETTWGDRLALPLDATPRQLHTEVDEPPHPDDHALILARREDRSSLQAEARVAAAARLAEQDGAQVIGFDITDGDEPG